MSAVEESVLVYWNDGDVPHWLASIAEHLDRLSEENKELRDRVRELDGNE